MPLFGSLNEMPPECQSDFLLIKKGFQERFSSIFLKYLRVIESIYFK